MKTDASKLVKRIAFVFWALSVVGTAAARFHVEGEMEATIYNASGAVQQTIPAQFAVSVDGTAWEITGYFANSNYTVSGCDGTNTFTLLCDNAQTREQAQPAWVTPGQYPLDVSWQTAVPWLAFASAAYLDEQTNDVIPGCWGHPRNEADMWILRSEIKRSADAPFLPLEVNYIVDRNLQMAAATNGNLLSAIPDNEINTAIFQYRPEFICGEYRVTATTNWNGLVLPAAFEVKRYYPKYTPRADYLGPAIIVAFQGRVRGFTSAPLELRIPKTDRLMSISDFRFSKRDVGVDFIRYASSNGDWPSPQEIKAEDLLRARVASAKESLRFFLKRKRGNQLSAFRRGFGLLGIGCVLLAPLIFLAVNKYKQRKAT